MLENLRNLEFPDHVMGFSFTEYQVIFLSLIFAFAVAEFFVSIGQVLKIRHRVSHYWEFWVWSFALICLFITTWYVSWLRLGYVSISMLHFLYAVIPNIMIFLIITTFFPRIPEKEALDLKDSFLDNRKWFFSLFAIYWGLNTLIEILLQPAPEQNATFGLLIHFLVSLANVFIDRNWLRTLYAIFFLAQLTVFLFLF